MCGFYSNKYGTLINKLFINDEAAEVQVVPAGYSHEFSLPAAECDSWLRTLWLKLLKEERADLPMDTAIIDYLQKKHKNSLRILVTGSAGAGKSALVNSIVEEYVAIEGNLPLGETTGVTKHEKRVGPLKIYIYDSPGLQGGINDNQHLNSLEENCREVDFNLYCMKMNGKIQRSDVDTMKKLSDALGKEEFWRKTLFVLTFANEVKLPKNSTPAQHFRKRKAEWKTLLQNMLNEKAGITANVPVVPAGWIDEPSLPDAPQRDWLSKLWIQCLDRIRNIVNPIILRINLEQIPQPPEGPNLND